MSKFKPQDFDQRVVIPCAHSGCPNPAALVKKLPTGWAQLCKAHDIFHLQQEANEFCGVNGLTVREKQMEFIRSKLGASRLFKRAARKIFREPGEEG